MHLFPTKNEQFWENVWLSAIEQVPDNKSSGAKVKRWDKRAAGFAKHTAAPEAVKRKEKILSMLKDAGALKSGINVLDIGAGPGNWAIPMVEVGAEVTALEPSQGMVDQLKKQVAEKGVEGISIDQRTWQEIDLEKDDFAGRFDLVFASMSPGVRDPETLRKAMKASRGFCYLSTFSGGGWRSCYNDMWKELFGQELESHSWDFIYPFNYIYSLGYRPCVDFHLLSHNREESIEEAIENIIFFVEMGTNITPDIRKKLAAYVEKNAVDGIFRQEHTICQGIMLWQVA